MQYLKRLQRTLGIYLLFSMGISGGLLAMPFVVSAAVPDILSFQGRLTDSSGNLLGGAGTTHWFRFRIYSAASGGTLLWESDSTNGTPVTVTQGVFSVLLGDTVLANMSALTVDFSGDTRWLEVDVSDDSSSGPFDTMSPRQRIAASGYALVAENVFGGYASVSEFRQTGLVNCNGPNDKIIYDETMSQFSCATEGTAGVASDSLNFDEFANALILDTNTTITGGVFGLTFDHASASETFEAALVKASTLGSDGGLIIDPGTGPLIIVGPASISGMFGPAVDNAYDLGSPTRRWRDVYVASSSLHIGIEGNEARFFYDTSLGFLGIDLNGDSIPEARFFTGGTASISGALEAGSYASVSQLFVDASIIARASVSSALEVAGSLLINGSILNQSGALQIAGAASVSNVLEVSSYASASQLFGAGLTDCDLDTQMLAWDATTGRFSCGDDDTGVAFNWLGLDFGAIGATPVKITSISFDDAHFALSNAASEGFIRLDWGTSGPASLSQNETVTGNWVNTANPWADNEVSDVLTVIGGTIGSNILSSGATFTGSASISANLEVLGYSSSSYLFGSGLSVCAAGQKLQYSVSGTFTCVADLDTDTTNSNIAFLTVGNTASLSLERSFAVDASTFTLTDAGANSTYTLGLATGLVVPTTASVSVWESFYDSPSSRITAGTGLSWAGNTLNSAGTFVASDAIDFDELEDALNLDADTTLTGGAFALTFDHASTSGTFETAILRATTITSDTSFVQITGRASVSSNFEVGGYASASSTFGSGLTDCDADGGQLLWDVTAGRFSCQTLADADIPNTITASNYVLLTGGALSGNLTGIGASFSAGEFTSYASASLYKGLTIALTGTGSNSFAGSLDVTNGLSFFGEIKPDGATCSTGQILKKTGPNDWDCAADDTSAGAGVSTIQEADVSIESAAITIDFSGAHFVVTSNPAGEANIGLDWGAGGPASLSQNETVTGAWTFGNNVSVSSGFNMEVAGYASSSRHFGSGLVDCDDSNQVVQWTASGSNAGKFSCVEGFSISSVQVFSGNGTWTKPANVSTVSVEVWGGGGGGGTAGTNASDGGGGGGGYSAGLVTVTGNVTVTVGAGGTSNGGAGGNSSFAGASTPTGSGGTGTTGVTGGAGGAASGGTINISGGTGENGVALDCGGAGDGGGSPMGGAGGGGAGGCAATGASIAGRPGVVPGGGGGGGAETAGAGGAGAAGREIVWAYSGQVGQDADVAEWYETDGSTLAGDVMTASDEMFTYETKTGIHTVPVLKKAIAGDKIFGVVSTNPSVLMGNDITRTARNPRPIALTGRVPVHVSTANGAIRPGDLLTISTLPGIAVRTEKAGQIIGSAIEAYNGLPGEIGTILVFVQTGYSTGARLKLVLAEQGINLDEIPENVDIGRVILAQMLQDKQRITRETALSELFTDRVVAGLEIIAPRVLADTVVAKHLEAAESNLELKLGEEGAFVITKNADEALSSTFGNTASATPGTVVISFDSKGNALFTGTLTAARLSGQIDAFDELGVQFASLSARVAGFSADDAAIASISVHLGELASLSASFQIQTLDAHTLFASAVASLESTVASISNRIEGLVIHMASASISRDAIVTRGLTVSGETTLSGDAYFFGIPYFTADTGGFAIIPAGYTEVEIIFEREYIYRPIVHATVAMDRASASDALEAALLDGELRYIVTRKDERGFTIRINSIRQEDIPFSWTALGVREPKTFVPIGTPRPLPAETLLQIPEYVPDLSPTPSIESTPEPTPEESPVESSGDTAVSPEPSPIPELTPGEPLPSE